MKYILIAVLMCFLMKYYVIMSLLNSLPPIGYSVIVALTGLPIGYSVIVALTGLPIGYSVIVALTGLPIGYSVIVALTGLPIGYSVIVALTGLPIGYSVIVALTGLPIGYSVIVALTGLPIGYSVIVALTGLPIRYSVMYYSVHITLLMFHHYSLKAVRKLILGWRISKLIYARILGRGHTCASSHVEKHSQMLQIVPNTRIVPTPMP